jgi:hypothetical protein
MTRRPWLPYAGWAALVGAVVLLAQPGLSYCAELHPRLCLNALVADAAAPWDAGQGLIVVLVLATGFTVIAAWRVLGHIAGVAFAAWAVMVSSVLLFYGRSIPTCLGPLGVTVDQCRAAYGLPPETAWDRFMTGPSPLIFLLLAGWLAIVAADAWWRRRQRGGL